MMGMTRLVLAGLALVMSFTSCSPVNETEKTAEEGTREPGVAMTTFYPLAYFAERIAGDEVEVQCPVPDDADPALWQPEAEAIRAYQQAEVIFINGASFEQWVATAPLPRSRVVDTTAGLKKDELLHYENATTHSHGPAGKHSHEGIDGHTWLDPVIALSQAQAVRDGLKRAYPDKSAAFDAGFVSLAADLGTLDESLQSLAEKMSGVTVIATHPAYNYLGRRYGWKLVNVNIDPDTLIKESEVSALQAELSDSSGGRIVLWETAPVEGNRATLEQSLGASSMVYDPSETRTDEGDYILRMRSNIDRLAAVISKE